MEWCRSDSLKLIKLYKQQECLWNPNHDYYKNKKKKNNAWNKMSDTMKCDSNEVKKKMESLLGSFRRERQKQDTSMKNGSGVVYTSTWFAFKYMFFLLKKFSPREKRNAEVNNEESIDADQKWNESELNSIQQVAWTNTQLPEPETPEDPIPKRKLVHESTNSSIVHNSKKRVTENIPHSSSEEAYQILKDTGTNLRDGSTIYGEHVALKHRKYSTHTQSVVEHLIGNILFNADMGKYEPAVAPSDTPSQLSSVVLEQLSTCSDEQLFL